MFSCELHKYNTKFRVMILLILYVCCILSTCVRFRDLAGSTHAEKVRVQDQILTIAIETPEEYERLHEDFSERYTDYQTRQMIAAMQQETNQHIVFYNQLIDQKDYGDIRLFEDIDAVLNRAKAYQSNLDSVLKNTVQRMIETADTDSYISRYYQKIGNSYMVLRKLEMEPMFIRGWNEYFSFSVPTIFMITALIVSLSGIFLWDYQAGMNSIMRVCRKGDFAVIKIKLVFIVVMTAFVTTVFSVTPLCVIAVMGGVSDPGVPIQMLDRFELCPYAATIFEYFLVSLLCRILTAAAAVIMITVLNRYFSSEIPGVLLVLPVFAVYAEKIYSGKSENIPAAVIDIHVLFEKFRSINLFGYCINYIDAVAAGSVLVGLLYAVLVCLRGNQFKIRQMKSKQGGRVQNLRNSLLLMELYKLFISRRGIYVVLIAVVMKVIFSWAAYHPNEDNTGVLLHQYLVNVQGAVTTEKIDYINTEEQFIIDAKEHYGKSKKAYDRGEISAEEYYIAEQEYNYAVSCEAACSALCERRDYLLSVLSEQPAVEFIYEKGIEKYLSGTMDAVGMMFVLLWCSAVFSCEYETRIDSLLRLTRRGRDETYRIKFLISFFTVLVFHIIFNLIEYAFLMHYYQIDYWNVPLVSIPDYQEYDPELSVLKYALICKSIGSAGTLFCFLITTSLNVLCQRQIKTLFCTFVLLTLPKIVSWIGADVLPDISIYGLLSPVRIYSCLPALFIWGVVSLLLFWTARKKWAGNDT